MGSPPVLGKVAPFVDIICNLFLLLLNFILPHATEHQMLLDVESSLGLLVVMGNGG